MPKTGWLHYAENALAPTCRKSAGSFMPKDDTMFMRWVEDNRGRMLKPEEADDIAKRILRRERFKFGKEEIFQVTSLAFASDVSKIDDFRKKAHFDDTIDGFCQSIGIVKP